MKPDVPVAKKVSSRGLLFAVSLCAFVVVAIMAYTTLRLRTSLSYQESLAQLALTEAELQAKQAEALRLEAVLQSLQAERQAADQAVGLKNAALRQCQELEQDIAGLRTHHAQLRLATSELVYTRESLSVTITQFKEEYAQLGAQVSHTRTLLAGQQEQLQAAQARELEAQRSMHQAEQRLKTAEQLAREIEARNENDWDRWVVLDASNTEIEQKRSYTQRLNNTAEAELFAGRLVLADLGRSIESLRVVQRDQRSSVQGLREQLAGLEATERAVQEALRSGRDQLAALSQQSETLTLLLAAQKAEKSELAGELAELTTLLGSRQDTLATLRTMLEAEADLVNSSIDAWRERVQLMLGEEIRLLEERRDGLRTERDALSTERDALRNEIEELTRTTDEE